MFNHAAINIANRQSILLTANNPSAELEEGVYDVYATVLTYIKVGDTQDAVSTSNDYPIPAGSIVTIIVPNKTRVLANQAVTLFKVD